MIGQLFLALILGAFLGLERELKKKPAGFQTYSLVSLASALFEILGFGSFVPVGIGFLGAGVIFKKEDNIFGLTTAAGLWLASAVGLAVGKEKYSLAFLATFLGLLIFLFFYHLEKKFFKKI
ncbi:MAG: MgtC/SapB family protein [Minisyncoccales bacterium]